MEMRLLCTLIVLTFQFGQQTAAQTKETATNALSLPELRSSLAEQLSDKRFARAAWGIKVFSFDRDEVVFEHEAEKLLKPASNAKLFTGALALDRFGPDYRIRTSVYSKELPRDGVVDGDLIIYGRGDFSMAARFRNGSYKDLLKPLAEAIAKSGVKRVKGNLVGEDTYFVGPRFGSSWAWDDLNYYYGAEVSALTVQDNVIDLIFRPGSVTGPAKLEQKPGSSYLQYINRTTTVAPPASSRLSVHRPLGSRTVYLNGNISTESKGISDAVTVPDPALWFVTLLNEALKAEGIQVAGEVTTRSWPEHAQTDWTELEEITFIESVPLEELVSKMMKPSQNLYAQSLLLQVGANSPEGKDKERWTEDLGVAELRKFSERLGIRRNEMLLDEGSGLSRSALVTPGAIIKLLQAMRTHKHAEAFYESLPVGGVDGTLRNRFTTPGLKKNVRAKTGTIRYVNALSGYMKTAEGENLAFSILSNAYYPGMSSGRHEIDQLITMFYRLARDNESATSH